MKLFPFRFTVFPLLAILSLAVCQNDNVGKHKIILWAWERPENLEFIDSKHVAVAFLAQTLELSGDKVNLVPRRQPLSVSKETKLIAVTRIETNKRSDDASLSDTQRVEILRLVLETLNLKNVSEIQIDFDATVSEREFYRGLLIDLRPKMPQGKGLSITALASWCVSKGWLNDLPIDEAVPMAFDMGADDKTIRDFLASGEDWAEPKCRQSYGISINEPLKMNFRRDRKFYLFTSNPRGWKKSDLENLPAGVKL